MEGNISSREAQNRFVEILRRVKQGEELTITHRNMPVAKIVPASRPAEEELRGLFEEIAKERSTNPLNPAGARKLSIRDLIEEGRE